MMTAIPHLAYSLCYIYYYKLPTSHSYIYYILRTGKMADEIVQCTTLMKKCFFLGLSKIFKKISKFDYQKVNYTDKLREKYTMNIVSFLLSFFTTSKIPFESFETMKRLDDIFTILQEIRGKIAILYKNTKQTISNTITLTILLCKMCKTQKISYFLCSVTIAKFFNFFMIKFSWAHVLFVFRVLRNLDDIMISFIRIGCGVSGIRKMDSQLLKLFRNLKVRSLYVLVFIVTKIVRKMSEIVAGFVKISKITQIGTSKTIESLRIIDRRLEKNRNKKVL